MSEARIILEQYDESMFDEFAEVVLQDSFLKLDMSNPDHVKMMRESLAQENSVLMAVRDADTHEFLGYCNIHDIDKEPWELGIELLERFWGKGIGYGALSVFVPLMAERYGKDGFIAKIAPDNLASIRLFQKLGATPREIRRGMFMLDEEMVERFARDNHDLIDGTIVEMATLFGVEPEYLLGRVLVFDVPAENPNDYDDGSTMGADTRNRGSQKPSANRSAEEYSMRKLAGELEALLEMCSDGKSTDEARKALEELQKKWGL